MPTPVPILQNADREQLENTRLRRDVVREIEQDEQSNPSGWTNRPQHGAGEQAVAGHRSGPAAAQEDQAQARGTESCGAKPS